MCQKNRSYPGEKKLIYEKECKGSAYTTERIEARGNRIKPWSKADEGKEKGKKED